MAREDNKVAKTTKWLFGALAVFALVLTLFILFFVLTQQGHILRKKEKTTVGEQKNSPKPPQKEISKVAPPEQTRPRVAIIIDDLGWNYTLALRLLKMDADFSFSILPNLKYSVKIAEEANKLNREILLHVPMESHENFKEFAPISPLRTTMNTEETQSVLSAYLRAVPYVKGINNHMGSKFTENEEGMKTVLLFLREKSLFFVDSLTTPKSVAYVLARKLGVQTARRTVFFDNDNTPEEIEKRVSDLQRIALKTGSAIGIGHPRKNTVLALRDMVVKLNDAGIRIVPVSKLVR